jgi:hypothetical protein
VAALSPGSWRQRLAALVLLAAGLLVLAGLAALVLAVLAALR